MLVKYFKNLVAVHDVKSAYIDLDLLGVEHYTTRALCIPFKEVYLDGKFQECLKPVITLYKKIGILPKKVNFMDSNDFFSSALGDFFTKKKKSKLSLFHRSDFTDSKINKILSDSSLLTGGISTEKEKKILAKIKRNVGLTPLESNLIANDKNYLRQVVAELGEKFATYNPNYFQEVVDLKIDEANFKKIGKKVVVKNPSSTGGDGVEIFSDYKSARKFIDTWRKKNPSNKDKFLYEEFVPLVYEGSAQFLVNKKFSTKFICLTKQIIDGVRHVGNVVSNVPKSPINNSITKKNIKDIGEIVAKVCSTSGYSGYLGVDFGKDKNGRVIVLEINARITGSTYPVVVLEVLSKKYKNKDFTIATTNAMKPKKALGLNDFYKLETLLNDSNPKLLFNPEKGNGVIPTLVSALPEKIGFIVSHKNEEKVESLINEVCNILL